MSQLTIILGSNHRLVYLRLLHVVKKKCRLLSTLLVIDINKFKDYLQLNALLY